MALSFTIRFSLQVYNLIWLLAIPFLYFNHRLREGFGERLFKDRQPGPTDFWIHAASVGEAFLALELLKGLDPEILQSMLITTNTSQGFDILTKNLKEPSDKLKKTPAIRYCPFDKPSIINKAVNNIRPRIIVLLETELWPGLLMASKKYGAKVLVINGRMRDKSLKQYLLWPGLWKALSPDRVLAMSKQDCQRFATLFGKNVVAQMNNIKFDRIAAHEPVEPKQNPLTRIVPGGSKFLVFGSIRQEEEEQIKPALEKILIKHPEIIVGLFPRHMHRLSSWQKYLDSLGLLWILRSEVQNSTEPIRVILWDTFGELTNAYELADLVFIGGSLAPLGGQNFLEPLICGVVPMTGRSWYNFAWVGREIVEQGLFREINDWQELVDSVGHLIEAPNKRNSVRQQAQAFIKEKQGGTKQACQEIAKHLN